MFKRRCQEATGIAYPAGVFGSARFFRYDVG
jgi:hypothetical protein